MNHLTGEAIDLNFAGNPLLDPSSAFASSKRFHIGTYFVICQVLQCLATIPCYELWYVTIKKIFSSVSIVGG